MMVGSRKILFIYCAFASLFVVSYIFKSLGMRKASKLPTFTSLEFDSTVKPSKTNYFLKSSREEDQKFMKTKLGFLTKYPKKEEFETFYANLFSIFQSSNPETTNFQDSCNFLIHDAVGGFSNGLFGLISTIIISLETGLPCLTTQTLGNYPFSDFYSSKLGVDDKFNNFWINLEKFENYNKKKAQEYQILLQEFNKNFTILANGTANATVSIKSLQKLQERFFQASKDKKFCKIQKFTEADHCFTECDPQKANFCTFSTSTPLDAMMNVFGTQNPIKGEWDIEEFPNFGQETKVLRTNCPHFCYLLKDDARRSLFCEKWGFCDANLAEKETHHDHTDCNQGMVLFGSIFNKFFRLQDRLLDKKRAILKIFQKYFMIGVQIRIGSKNKDIDSRLFITDENDPFKNFLNCSRHLIKENMKTKELIRKKSKKIKFFIVVDTKLDNNAISFLNSRFSAILGTENDSVIMTSQFAGDFEYGTKLKETDDISVMDRIVMDHELFKHCDLGMITYMRFEIFLSFFHKK